MDTKRIYEEMRKLLPADTNLQLDPYGRIHLEFPNPKVGSPIGRDMEVEVVTFVLDPGETNVIVDYALAEDEDRHIQDNLEGEDLNLTSEDPITVARELIAALKDHAVNSRGEGNTENLAKLLA